MSEPRSYRIYYMPANTEWEAWYRASLRRDLRDIGLLGGEETDEERALIEAGPPSRRPAID